MSSVTGSSVDKDLLEGCEERTSCVVCGATQLDVVFSVEKVPVYMGCTDQPVSEDVHLDQVWASCSSCKTVQLKTLAPLDLVYLKQHNAALGGMWKRHHEAFGEFIARLSPERITEVGGANGALAKAYTDAHSVDSWTVVEPNPTFSASGKVKLVKAFIEDVPDTVAGADVVVHSHLFEHLYKPTELLDSLRQQMQDGAAMVFSVPNIPALLRASGSNALNFEHTYYFDPLTLIWVLQSHGFELRSLELFEQHSIFVKAVATGTAIADRQPPTAESGLTTFKQFVDDTRSDVKQLVEKAQNFDGAVYLFGAHVFSQFLVASGFPPELAAGVLDNDSAKQGLRLYGSELEVLAPDAIAGQGKVAVVVRASQYNAEISTQLKELSNQVEIW